MKYFHLIWAALFRRKTRTFLTLASILAAFLLFGLLDGIRTSFAQLGQNSNGAQRLQTASRLSFIETLPISLEPRIKQIDNIQAVKAIIEKCSRRTKATRWQGIGNEVRKPGSRWARLVFLRMLSKWLMAINSTARIALAASRASPRKSQR